MLIIKIGKRIRLEKSGINGFKIFIRIKENWYHFKLTDKEIELLNFMLRSKIK